MLMFATIVHAGNEENVCWDDADTQREMTMCAAENLQSVMQQYDDINKLIVHKYEKAEGFL